MGLLDEVFAAQAVPPKKCKVARLLDEMPKQDAEETRQALANPRVHTETLARVLSQHGYPLGSSTVSLHRRGDCCCVVSR